MKTKLLLISQGSTFMVDAIAKNLLEVGLDVIRAEPKIKDLRGKLDEVNHVLIYLGDYIEENKDAFVYLKDACIEQEKYIHVIGDASEVEDLRRVTADGLIENVFSRPLDIKRMAEVMAEVGSESGENAKKKSILLVDDDPTFLRMVRGWLSNKYRVTIVNSGMQAITYIAKNTPDLVLLDYEMPVTSGPQVLEMIKSENETSMIPVIFLTGKDDKESVTKVLSLKPQGYILKNAGRQALLEQIGKFFESVKEKQY